MDNFYTVRNMQGRRSYKLIYMRNFLENIFSSKSQEMKKQLKELW